MKDEEIFELAESNGYQDDFGRWNFTDEELLDFVFDIRKAEREECAKVCEDISEEFAFEPHDPDPFFCAEAIRARGEK